MMHLPKVAIFALLVAQGYIEIGRSGVIRKDTESGAAAFLARFWSVLGPGWGQG